MTAAYREPEVADPRTLAAGDQVACADGSRRLHLLVGEGRDVDPIWLTLGNDPAETAEVDGWPVHDGQVALDLTEQGWTVGALPTVWARRRIG